jgi:hypothetical protein
MGAALSSYTRERQPVGLRNARLSVEYGRKVFDLVKAFKLVNSDIEKAVEGMNQALADPRQRQEIEQQVEAQRAQFTSVS